MQQHSIGREAAIKLHETRWWESKTARQICEVQLFTEELCCPFSVFHEALNEALGRGVYTHEMAGDRIVQEFLGQAEPPTLAEILAMLNR